MSAPKLSKAIIFTAQASEAHNSIKLNNVLKWLKAGHEVRVQINGKPDRKKAMDAIYKQIEDETKTGVRFIQKISKPESIRVILRPTEEASNFKISATKETIDVESEIQDIMSNKDIFSEEFEKELEQSIIKDRKKK